MKINGTGGIINDGHGLPNGTPVNEIAGTANSRDDFVSRPNGPGQSLIGAPLPPPVPLDLESPKSNGLPANFQAQVRLAQSVAPNGKGEQTMPQEEASGSQLQAAMKRYDFLPEEVWSCLRANPDQEIILADPALMSVMSLLWEAAPLLAGCSYNDLKIFVEFEANITPQILETLDRSYSKSTIVTPEQAFELTVNIILPQTDAAEQRTSLQPSPTLEMETPIEVRSISSFTGTSTGDHEDDSEASVSGLTYTVDLPPAPPEPLGEIPEMPEVPEPMEDMSVGQNGFESGIQPEPQEELLPEVPESDDMSTVLEAPSESFPLPPAPPELLGEIPEMPEVPESNDIPTVLEAPSESLSLTLAPPEPLKDLPEMPVEPAQSMTPPAPLMPPVFPPDYQATEELTSDQIMEQVDALDAALAAANDAEQEKLLNAMLQEETSLDLEAPATLVDGGDGEVRGQDIDVGAQTSAQAEVTGVTPMPEFDFPTEEPKTESLPSVPAEVLPASFTPVRPLKGIALPQPGGEMMSGFGFLPTNKQQAAFNQGEETMAQKALQSAPALIEKATKELLPSSSGPTNLAAQPRDKVAAVTLPTEPLPPLTALSENFPTDLTVTAVDTWVDNGLETKQPAAATGLTEKNTTEEELPMKKTIFTIFLVLILFVSHSILKDVSPQYQAWFGYNKMQQPATSIPAVSPARRTPELKAMVMAQANQKGLSKEDALAFWQVLSKMDKTQMQALIAQAAKEKWLVRLTMLPNMDGFVAVKSQLTALKMPYYWFISTETKYVGKQKQVVFDLQTWRGLRSRSVRDVLRERHVRPATLAEAGAFLHTPKGVAVLQSWKEKGSKEFPYMYIYEKGRTGGDRKSHLYSINCLTGSLLFVQVDNQMNVADRSFALLVVHK